MKKVKANTKASLIIYYGGTSTFTNLFKECIGAIQRESDSIVGIGKIILCMSKRENSARGKI